MLADFGVQVSRSLSPLYSVPALLHYTKRIISNLACLYPTCTVLSSAIHQRLHFTRQNGN